MDQQVADLQTAMQAIALEQEVGASPLLTPSPTRMIPRLYEYW